MLYLFDNNREQVIYRNDSKDDIINVALQIAHDDNDLDTDVLKSMEERDLNELGYYVINREELEDLIKEQHWDDTPFEDIHIMLEEANIYHDIDYYANDNDFFEMMYGNDIMEAVRAVQYGDYNYIDVYVRINAYGNLESFYDTEDLRGEIEDYIGEYVDHLLDNVWDIEPL